MFEKNIQEIWSESKDDMWVRGGSHLRVPHVCLEIDGNYRILSSDQLCRLFDLMQSLPIADCQGGAKAWFTALRNPYIMHVYLEVNSVGHENNSFEVFDALDANKRGQGLANTDAIKNAIQIIGRGDDVFKYLHENANVWDDEE